MTTPAQDAPFVLPAVAFRPARLGVICLVIAGVVTGVATWMGSPLFGAFFALGLALGLINALLVRRAVTAITNEAHPLKAKMAANSAGRLLVFGAIALLIAWKFQPAGLGTPFGLALFEALLVISTSLPVLKKLRAQANADAVSNDG